MAKFGGVLLLALAAALVTTSARPLELQSAESETTYRRRRAVSEYTYENGVQKQVEHTCFDFRTGRPYQFCLYACAVWGYNILLVLTLARLHVS